MKLSDQRLLLDFSRLMLRIAHAQNPTCLLDVTDKTVTRTPGHKKHRAFFLSLSQKKRDAYRKQLQAQVTGIRKLIEQAEARGEKPDLSELTIQIYDAETGKPIRAEDAPVLEPAEPDDEPPQATEHEAP